MLLESEDQKVESIMHAAIQTFISNKSINIKYIVKQMILLNKFIYQMGSPKLSTSSSLKKIPHMHLCGSPLCSHM